MGLKAIAGLLSCIVFAPQALAADFREDVVSGSCSALVKHVQQTGVTDSTGKSWPNSWGAAERSVSIYIGQRAQDDPLVVQEHFYDEIDRSHAGMGGTDVAVCLAAERFGFSFRADNKISVIEWQHKYKPDSKCAKEWQRVRNIIRNHELQHVRDYEQILNEENARIPTLPPVTACGATRADASDKLGDKVVALVKQEARELKKKLDAKQAERDREYVQMNCKLCNQKISFKNVTIDCTIPTPKCKIRTGQRLEGQACGDPTSATWKISPHYFSEGCGARPSGSKGDKPFDTDCVEAGSDIEKQRVEVYKRFRPKGAGGWMCVYSDAPRPKITIRSFRLPMCEGPDEQTVTVDAELSDEECEESSGPPVPPTTTPPAFPNS